MSIWSAIKDPLLGKTSLARVFWVYGVLGSVLVSVLGMFIDTGNETMTRVYAVFGLVFTIYVTVATYQCAGNCVSKFIARVVRISAVLSLALLPLLAYFYYTGALSLALIGQQ